MSAKQTDASRTSAPEQTEQSVDRGTNVNDIIMSIIESLTLLKNELMARWQVIEKIQAENAALKKALDGSTGSPTDNPA
jgi:DNA polymerase sigma